MRETEKRRTSDGDTPEHSPAGGAANSSCLPEQTWNEQNLASTLVTGAALVGETLATLAI
jgi:hypothetical protein